MLCRYSRLLVLQKSQKSLAGCREMLMCSWGSRPKTPDEDEFGMDIDCWLICIKRSECVLKGAGIIDRRIQRHKQILSAVLRLFREEKTLMSDQCIVARSRSYGRLITSMVREKPWSSLYLLTETAEHPCPPTRLTTIQSLRDATSKARHPISKNPQEARTDLCRV